MNWLNFFFKKNKIFIFGFLLLLFFRLPSFFESLWYGDENYYLAMAQGIVKGGEWLYVGVWDNKPPLIYILYSVSVWVFGTQLWPLRVLNFFLGFLTSFLTYKISKKFFNFSEGVSKIAFIISILLESIYFEVTIFNGENLFVPLVLLGFYLIAPKLLFLAKLKQNQEIPLSSGTYKNIFLGGLIWSLAILTKIPALAEIGWLMLLLYVVWFVQSIGKVSQIQAKFIEFITNKKVWTSLLLITVSILALPLLIGFVYFVNGYFQDLWFAVWQYNNQYYLPENSNPIVLGFTVPFKSLYFRTFLVLGALFATTASFLQGQFKPGNIGQNGFVIINWLCITTFSVFIAERPYPHYLQQILPISTILLAWIISLIKLPDFNLSSKVSSIIATLLFFQILLTNFTGGTGVLNYFNINKYWGKLGFNSVITGQQSLTNWQRGFDEGIYDRTQILVPEIQKYSKDGDYIFLGSVMPEIYVESGRLNAYKYVVDYHPLVGISVSQLYNLLSKKAQLILIDSKSDLSGKLLPYLQKNFIFQETIDGRYSIWVNISKL